MQAKQRWYKMKYKEKASAMKSTNGQSVALAVVALLAGILLGVIGANVFNITDDKVTQKVRQEDKTNTPAANYKATLNQHFLNHTYLLRAAMAAEYENNNAALEVILERLEANTEQLASEFSFVDGDLEREFVVVWGEYTEAFLVYAQAGSEGEGSAMEVALGELDTVAASAAELLAEQLEMNQEDLLGHLQLKNEALTRSFNADVAANYNESYEQLNLALSSLTRLANELATAAVVSYPDEF